MVVEFPVARKIYPWPRRRAGRNWNPRQLDYFGIKMSIHFEELWSKQLSLQWRYFKIETFIKILLKTPCTVRIKYDTRASQIKTLNMFYLLIYWTQNVYNDFIFLCSVLLPPVGHSSNHEYHCWILQDIRAVVAIFIALIKFSFDSPSYYTHKISIRTSQGTDPMPIFKDPSVKFV